MEGSFPLFFEDLSPCMYVASSLAEGGKLKAVGWLAWGHPYTHRQVQLQATRFGQLIRLLVDPWEPLYFMGSHECEFCPEEPLQDLEAYYRRHEIERDGLVVHFGANNLYVPADGCVYVAPSMIAHYVDVHSYEPPAVFWEAVMNCPEMGSETYRQALIVNGPANEDWVRAVQAG
jgi:hypothetical protein